MFDIDIQFWNHRTGFQFFLFFLSVETRVSLFHAENDGVLIRIVLVARLVFRATGVWSFEISTTAAINQIKRQSDFLFFFWIIFPKYICFFFCRKHNGDRVGHEWFLNYDHIWSFVTSTNRSVWHITLFEILFLISYPLPEVVFYSKSELIFDFRLETIQNYKTEGLVLNTLTTNYCNNLMHSFFISCYLLKIVFR